MVLESSMQFVCHAVTLKFELFFVEDLGNLSPGKLPTAKSVLVATEIKQATCFKQAGFHFPIRANT